MKNWKSIAAGVGAILVAVGNALTGVASDAGAAGVDWTATVVAVIAGVGLVLAGKSKAQQS